MNLIGVDEVGRGCLAGPVVAAAVLFLKPVNLDAFGDSKKLSPQVRKVLSTQLKNLTFTAIGVASVQEINEINIRNATFLAMRRAIGRLCNEHQLWTQQMPVWVDGIDKIPDLTNPQTAIVRGDEKIAEIKAASIIAKVYRDNYMTEVCHKLHPQYDWATNKGYGTVVHVEAIKKYGLTPLHRNYKKFLAKLGLEYDQCRVVEKIE